jgi:hypothetical protein
MIDPENIIEAIAGVEEGSTVTKTLRVKFLKVLFEYCSNQCLQCIY